MWKTMIAEGIKLRRTWVWPPVYLGPFGVISLTATRYALRYTYLVHPGADNWGQLVSSINSLSIPALVLGIAIVSSMISGMEHRGRMWKQMLALPVRRTHFYIGKFMWLLILLFIASMLCSIGALGLGIALGFGFPIPFGHVATSSVYPYLASYALIALQLLLSVTVVNQASAIMVGVIAVIASFAFRLLPQWLPWVYPTRAAFTHGYVDALQSVAIWCLGWPCFACGMCRSFPP